MVCWYGKLFLEVQHIGKATQFLHKFTLISTINANNKHKYFHRRGGLQPGDVVVSINDKPIINTQDIYRILEVKESQIKISVIRKREKINFLISLEDSPN